MIARLAAIVDKHVSVGRFLLCVSIGGEVSSVTSQINGDQ